MQSHRAACRPCSPSIRRRRRRAECFDAAIGVFECRQRRDRFGLGVDRLIMRYNHDANALHCVPGKPTSLRRRDDALKRLAPPRKDRAIAAFEMSAFAKTRGHGGSVWCRLGGGHSHSHRPEVTAHRRGTGSHQNACPGKRGPPDPLPRASDKASCSSLSTWCTRHVPRSRPRTNSQSLNDVDQNHFRAHRRTCPGLGLHRSCAELPAEGRHSPPRLLCPSRSRDQQLFRPNAKL